VELFLLIAVFEIAFDEGGDAVRDGLALAGLPILVKTFENLETAGCLGNKDLCGGGVGLDVVGVHQGCDVSLLETKMRLMRILHDGREDRRFRDAVETVNGGVDQCEEGYCVVNLYKSQELLTAEARAPYG
jgi:hypothetical protein